MEGTVKHYANAKFYYCKYCNSKILSRRCYYEHVKACGERLKCELDSKGRVISTDAKRKSSETLRDRLKSGEIKPTWLGKKLPEEMKEKIRLSAINRLNFSANYNKEACSFIDDLNEMFNWKLQHAENGGEITIGGYFLDGYDKDLNIAFEYDEKRHYLDAYENILKEKDYKRMCFIHTKTNCRFFRYNEKLNLLYEVTNFEKIHEIKANTKSHKIIQNKKVKKEKKEKKIREDLEYLKNENMVRSDGVYTNRAIPQSEWERRKNLLLNAKTDMTKFGWVGKMEKEINETKRIIEETLERFPEIFEGKFFRRKINH